MARLLEDSNFPHLLSSEIVDGVGESLESPKAPKLGRHA